MWAAFCGKEAIVNTLIQNGADLYIKSDVSASIKSINR